MYSSLFGRGFAAMLNPPQSRVEELLEERVAEDIDKIAKMDISKPAPPKPVIEWARDNAVSLLDRMTDRKSHWERVIREATEELRQVNVIIDGTKQMLSRIEVSYPLKGAQEVSTTSQAPIEMTQEELVAVLMGGADDPLGR